MAAAPRHVMIRRVVWWWYLVPIVPILALGYAALTNMLPSWALLVALFAFFMWLMSLVFTVFRTVMQRFGANKEPRQ
ncbi:hypothetical protein [Devosia sp. SL43]|uniref:hypothetical protein n=1 Tax=Devosia sp. SL43 TaxID=2806348 RepID=UPI001F48359E|nr:hypothetical protein [Devosia sp. SL43]UJW84347.1 hypothetical protein IM737_12995 [Devosia sp. SL43]